jgi:hypothetical protein
MRSLSAEHVLSAVLALIGVTLSGCGSERRANTIRLEGQVKLDGEPLAEGNLQILPEGKSRGQPDGAVVVDGRYTADNVPLGKVRVIISATKETGRMMTDTSVPYPERISIIPPRYRDGIVIEVKEGDEARDFDLTTK